MSPVDRRSFFDIMGTAPAAVTVVTTIDAAGRPRGLTVGAVCSVSAEPPLLLICVDQASRTLLALRERGAFTVNFLDGDGAEVARRFASPVADRFAGIPWRPGQNGLPILDQDGLAHAECRIVQELASGDHVILIALVEAGSPPAPGTRPLMYFRHQYGAWSGNVEDARLGVAVAGSRRP
ncbi:MAG: flavin reductase family protein [Chloroflexi bacterium]|nr:flavin reductase family protein [Chloroflexota bacterium]